MHEYHIVELMVGSIISAAREKGIAAPVKVSLRISELANLEESSIRLYFQEIAKGSILEHARLEIMTLPARLKCKKCDIVFPRQKGQFNCPKCGELASALPAEKFTFALGDVP